MTGELVGPVPTIRFYDGTRQAYEQPRNTSDPRHAACIDHRPACDCREAEFAEDRAENRAVLRAVEAAAEEVLAGHHAYAWAHDLDGRQIDVGCMCTGCQIARRGNLLAAWTVSNPDIGASR